MTRLLAVGMSLGIFLGAFGVQASPWSGTVARHEGVPSRPLILQPGRLQPYGGLSIDLSSNVAFDTISVPVGAGFGVIDKLELGADLDLLMRPWEIEDVLNQIRIYGRYLLIPDLLAVEGAFWVPTAGSDTLGLEVLLPARYTIENLEIFGQGRLGYFGSEAIDMLTFGVAATGLYSIDDSFVAIADLGLSANPYKPDFGFGSSDWSTNFILPFGFGAGYRVNQDSFIKAVFQFSDLASDAPFDGRSFHVLYVQAVSLKDDTATPTSSEPASPSGSQDDPKATETK